MTEVETWLYQSEPKDKTQSKQWLSKGGKSPSKTNTNWSGVSTKQYVTRSTPVTWNVFWYLWGWFLLKWYQFSYFCSWPLFPQWKISCSAMLHLLQSFCLCAKPFFAWSHLRVVVIESCMVLAVNPLL